MSMSHTAALAAVAALKRRGLIAQDASNAEAERVIHSATETGDRTMTRDMRRPRMGDAELEQRERQEQCRDVMRRAADSADLDDDDIQDVIEALAENYPELMGTAMREMAADNRGPKGWARDRAERRHATDALRAKDAMRARKFGITGRDNPPPFEGMPEPGGRMYHDRDEHPSQREESGCDRPPPSRDGRRSPLRLRACVRQSGRLDRKNLMSKPTASQRLPERARLAAVIERHADAAEQLARVEAAIQKISDDRVNDRVAISRAREALKIAATGRSEIIIANALGEEPPDLPDPEEAQAMLDKAEASLDASRYASQVLDGEQRQAKFSLDLAERALNRAVNEVVASDPALAALRAEFERTRAHLSEVIGALLGSGNEVSRIAWTEAAFVPDRAWTDALTRLREDPDAELPGLPPNEPDDAHRGSDNKRAA